MHFIRCKRRLFIGSDGLISYGIIPSEESREGKNANAVFNGGRNALSQLPHVLRVENDLLFYKKSI